MIFKPLAGEPNPYEPLPPGRHWARELRLDHFRSERELADRVLERLEPHFLIKREIWGSHCSNKRLRIDALIQPRDSENWRNPQVALGVEFKIPQDGTNGYTRWLAQAVSYTHVNWDGYGRRIVLTCPGAATWLDSGTPRDYEHRSIFLAKRISGSLGCGRACRVLGVRPDDFS